jgi:hypothetical protein
MSRKCQDGCILICLMKFLPVLDSYEFSKKARKSRGRLHRTETINIKSAWGHPSGMICTRRPGLSSRRRRIFKPHLHLPALASGASVLHTSPPGRALGRCGERCQGVQVENPEPLKCRGRRTGTMYAYGQTGLGCNTHKYRRRRYHCYN